MTKSPVSTCGVKTGLSLPRRTIAMRLARRPSGLSDASTTHHFRSAIASAGRAEKVLNAGLLAGAGAGAAGFAASAFSAALAFMDGSGVGTKGAQLLQA